MAASTQYRFPWSVAYLSSSTAQKPYLPLNILCSKYFRPFTASKLNPSSRVSRSKFFRAETAAPMLARRVFRARGSADYNSVASPEPESDNSEAGATIDLRLPRRSLLLQFTCDLCGEKTRRLKLISLRKCAGCLRYHKLVDNLGLITEYDFREEPNMESETDQV